ncbi:MAG: NUDIX hydrolase [Halanaeroarchaeum sp.]
MPVDDLWYLATRATQRAERAYHRLVDEYDDFLERERHRSVSRRRFERLAGRVERTGAPYGAHTIVYRPSGELLLVYHDQVGKWVLPGGEVGAEETFRDAAERELAEEAGIGADYGGLAILGRVSFDWRDHDAWGVLPVFQAEARGTDLRVEDPDGEISDARWFGELPEATRDRADIQAWRREYLA